MLVNVICGLPTERQRAPDRSFMICPCIPDRISSVVSWFFWFRGFNAFTGFMISVVSMVS